jgi:hypothetical protein
VSLKKSSKAKSAQKEALARARRLGALAGKIKLRGKLKDPLPIEIAQAFGLK